MNRATTGTGIQIRAIRPTIAEFAAVVHSIRAPFVTCTSIDDLYLAQIKASLPQDGHADVVSLIALIRRVSVILRRAGVSVANGEQTRIACRMACESLEPESPFAPLRAFKGFHEAAASTLGELRHWGYQPADLDRLAAEADPEFAPKLHALSELGAGIDGILNTLARSFATNIAESQIGAELPPGASLEALGHLCIHFGNLQMPGLTKWLKWLSGLGLPMTLVFDQQPGNQESFAPARAAAAEFGASLKSKQKPTTWMDILFAGEQVSAADLKGPVPSVIGIHDRLAECEWVVRQCFREIDAGTNPTAIAVLAHHADVYGPIFTAAARLHRLPCAVRVSAPLLSNAFVGFVLQALQVLAQADVRALYPVLQNGYMRIVPSEHEMYATAIMAAYRENDQAWQHLTEWARAEDGTRWLTHWLALRDEALGTRRPLTEWLTWLGQLLTMEPLSYSASEESNPTFERDLMAKNRAEATLSSAAAMQDSREARDLSFPEFVATCDSLWQDQVTSLPSHDQGGVQFVRDVRFVRPCDVLFVLGMAEGQVPRRRAEDPVLTDDDRVALHALDPRFEPMPSSLDRVAEARDEFVRLCCAPKKRLVLSYPLTDGETEFTPSFFLDEVIRLMGERVVMDPVGRENVIPRLNACVTPFDLALRTALDHPEPPPRAPKLETEAAQDRVAVDFESGVAPAMIALASQCAFSAVCRHLLNLERSRFMSAWSDLAALPAKVNLASLVDLDSAQQLLQAALAEEIAGRFHELEPWQLGLLEQMGHRAISQWILRERLARQHWEIDPTDTKTNLSLGIAGTRSTFKRQGVTLSLAERVPALVHLHGAPMAMFYRNSLPSKKSDDLARWVEISLIAACLREPGRTYGVIVEPMWRERRAYMIRGDNRPPKAVTGRLESEKFDEDDRAWGAELFEHVDRAIRALRDRTMQAHPGPSCKSCGFGELCRISSEFGTRTPFVAGGERE